MVEEVEVIDGIKIFEFSSEIKLFRHTFADEFARRDDLPFLGFDEDDLYCSNQIFKKFGLHRSEQSEPRKPSKNNSRRHKRKSNGEIKTVRPAKRITDDSFQNKAAVNVKSDTKTVFTNCDASVQEGSAVRCRRSGDVEIIILDDDSDNYSIDSSVDSGTETMRVSPDEPPVIEIDDSDSESADSAMSLSSPLSLLSAPTSPSPLRVQEPSEKITYRQTIRSMPSAEPALKPSGALTSLAHVITPTCGKTMSSNRAKTIQNPSTLKMWGVQKKMSPPVGQPMKKAPILKEKLADCGKNNRENVDNNNLVVPAQKTACTYSLACLSPGVGYIPLLEFGINTIKFEDPFGTGKVKMYGNVMHATKWLNSEVQARLNFEASGELKWTVANAAIVQAKRLSRFDFLALSRPNCRITKNGVIFS